MHFFKSVEDEDIFPEVKKAAALEAAEDLTGVLLSAEGCGGAVDSKFSLLAVGSGSEFTVVVEAAPAVATVVTSVLEVAATSSWMGLKDAPTENRNKTVKQMLIIATE